MTRMRRDLDHSLAEVEGAMLEMMDAYGVVRPRRPAIWDLIVEKLLVKEIDFLTDRAEEMTQRDKDSLIDYLIDLATWRNKWGGEMNHDAPVGHAVALASIGVPLLRTYWGSAVPDEVNWLLTAAMQNCKSCSVRYMPNDEISERDIPLIRGQLMTNIVLTELGCIPTPGVYDNVFYSWLGEHEEDVREMFTEIKKRGSFDPMFVRELVGEVAKPISAGVL